MSRAIFVLNDFFEHLIQEELWRSNFIEMPYYAASLKRTPYVESNNLTSM